MLKERVKIGMVVKVLLPNGEEHVGTVVSTNLYFVAVKCGEKVFHTVAAMCDEMK